MFLFHILFFFVYIVLAQRYDMKEKKGLRIVIID